MRFMLIVLCEEGGRGWIVSLAKDYRNTVSGGGGGGGRGFQCFLSTQVTKAEKTREPIEKT
jgi:hypothetical protein